MNNIQFKIITFIFTVILVGTGIAFIVETNSKQETKSDFDYQCFELGKSVGRNAMLQYIGKHTSDTIRIEIKELLILEDSLSKAMLK
jgi:hypothetical protein